MKKYGESGDLIDGRFNEPAVFYSIEEVDARIAKLEQALLAAELRSHTGWCGIRKGLACDCGA